MKINKITRTKHINFFIQLFSTFKTESPSNASSTHHRTPLTSIHRPHHASEAAATQSAESVPRTCSSRRVGDMPPPAEHCPGDVHDTSLQLHKELCPTCLDIQPPWSYKVKFNPDKPEIKGALENT